MGYEKRIFVLNWTLVICVLPLQLQAQILSFKGSWFCEWGIGDLYAPLDQGPRTVVSDTCT